MTTHVEQTPAKKQSAPGISKTASKVKSGLIPVNPAGIPLALKARKQWVLWRQQKRHGKKTKVPFNVNTGRLASVNQPESWSTYADALKAYKTGAGDYDGIGYVFSAEDPYAGIDLDQCRDPETGKIEPWAQKIFDKFKTYAEVSPSGTGVKMFCVGTLAATTGIKKSFETGAVELYDHSRYFTMTGAALDGMPAEPEKCQAQLNQLLTQINAPKATTPANAACNAPHKTGSAEVSDDQILEKACAAANGEKFARLWAGDHSEYTSQSSADLALAGRLAFWVGPDANRIDQLFRKSGLYRPKWDTPRGELTYGRLTIDKALEGREDFYDWNVQARVRPTPSLEASLEWLETLQAAAAEDPATAFLVALSDQDVFECLATASNGDRRAYEELLLTFARGGVKTKEVDGLKRAVGQAAKQQQRSTAAATTVSQKKPPYRATPEGLFYDKPYGDGVLPTQLTNFRAEITMETGQDDGAEVQRMFTIAAELDSQSHTLTIPAAQYASMAWPIRELGARALVLPGFSNADHARAAIQLLSSPVKRTVYTHTGFRFINGQWLYLHAGGAIGAAGSVPGVEVMLSGELQNFDLPEPPTGERLQVCILESLKLRKLAPLHVTCCLEGATFRAPLGNKCDSSLFVTGPTGAGKSEGVSPYQQHYGARMNRLGLPGNFVSTANAIEAKMHAAKDTLFCVDDFCPQGSQQDIRRYHQIADRIFRGVRNQAGRMRLTAEGTLRATKTPRCLPVGTGEDIPTGHSLRASLMILELTQKLDLALLSQIQEQGAAGTYAATMAAYVQWLAGRYDEVSRNLPVVVSDFRARVQKSPAHRRTPTIAADLLVGTHYFLMFAADIGAISAAEQKTYFDEAWEAIGKAAAMQSEYLSHADPARRFIELVLSAVASGEAHLASASGNAPKKALLFGWKPPEGTHDGFVARGKQIGWADEGNIYLDPEAALKAAQEMARHGESIAIGSKTLHKRLHQAGFLVSTETDHLTVRKTLQGRARHVLHIRADVWHDDEQDQVDQGVTADVIDVDGDSCPEES